ncbi:glutathione reductase [Emiliania huxleyi CCMP1516]|uniref:Glutathione-disulfide reductase n=2 Tax=Emiliania huxleyi TaxID=2903 RepID=A0A0D3JGH0_EMIH1|nr:glutathione reductase [Emiliania huxleyi CCMP1516]EOD22605.1 glutathione reductase [Emiliania huxleyi CCMP1516]|eukprot:XP_005775034.1 glutathione reductase [Emiliania huxleyi CCMP1516]
MLLAIAASALAPRLALRAAPGASPHAASCVRMAAPEEFDYLVIGGGSGGIASARRAAAHGARACVIERSRLGGTCVNVGGASFDMKAIKAKRDAYVTRLNGIYANNLANSDVTFVEGDARFTGPKTVAVGDRTLTGKSVLIAVGGRPSVPDIPGAAELGITSDGFFELDSVPDRVAVIGSGYIAVELAGILQVLGSKVDLFIRGATPLRSMESDVVERLVGEMEAAGISIVRGEAEAISGDAASKTVVLKDGKGEHGGPTAIAAGRLLSDRLFGGASEADTLMDYDFVPTVVFSHPPLASTWVNMLYSREFLVDGQHMPKTFAKLVCVGPEQRVVGLHMIGLPRHLRGAAAPLSSGGFALAMKMGATKADFDSVVAIHPTSSEELAKYSLRPDAYTPSYEEEPVPAKAR